MSQPRSEHSRAERNETIERLPRARLAPAGATGFDAARWVRWAAGIALALSAAWWLWSWRRPLPEPQVDKPDPPPSGQVAGLPETPSIQQRDRLLASLTERGNLFAPDRQLWEHERIAEAEEGNAESSEDATQKDGDDQASADEQDDDVATAAPRRGEQIDIDRLDITSKEDMTVAVRKKVEDLRLRGVYRSEQGPAALISDRKAKHRSRSRIYRPGETFDEGEWRVLAIDTEGDRVILRQADVNVELRMHEPIDGATIVSSEAEASDDQPAPIVQTASPEQVRRELTQAGVDEKEIDALLRLARGESDEPQVAQSPDEKDSEKTRGDDRAALSDAESIPDAPEGFSELLKMMASGDGPGGGDAEQPASSEGDGGEEKE